MRSKPHVVTVGGGHGQAAMLRALLRLDCEITALVGIADDGGCSGRLRAEFDMPPPGDLRRCLSTLAPDRQLAAMFEERFEDEHDEIRRSAGNLALFEVYVERGTLSAAARWAVDLLSCRGRVLPVSDVPGRLTIYDRGAGVLEGETTIEEEGQRPMVVGVHGPERCLPDAATALAEADLVVISPGSFVTSTLAAVMTGDLAEAIVTSPASRVMVQNLAEEALAPPSVRGPDHLRLLRDHLCIGSGRDDFELMVLADGSEHRRRVVDAYTTMLTSPISDLAVRSLHDAERVADALSHHFGLAPRIELTEELEDWPARRELETYLRMARARLTQRSSYPQPAAQ